MFGVAKSTLGLGEFVGSGSSTACLDVLNLQIGNQK
jgi:hypothetical protein